MANPDLLVFTALHGAKHSFHRLTYVLDIARTLEQMEPSEGEQAFRIAQEHGLVAVLALGCSLAQRLFSSVVPVQFARVLARNAHVDAHASEIARRLMAGPPSVHQNPVEVFRLYSRTHLGLAGRLRHRVDLALFVLDQVNQADLIFAARFGVHPKRVWAVRALRIIRLIQLYGRG